MAEHRGGSGNFAEDRDKASEAGKRRSAQRRELQKRSAACIRSRKKAVRTAIVADVSLITPDCKTALAFNK